MGTPATRKPPTSPGLRSAMSGAGYHPAAEVSLGRMRLISESAGMSAAGAESRSAATTSIEVISGAAARTASSTANSSVIADDLQQCHVAAVRPQIRSDAVQRVLDPAFHAVGVQSVHQHEAGDEFVGGELTDQFGCRAGRDRHHAL